MGDIAIKVDSLGKMYRIGMKDQVHDTLIGAMASWVTSPIRNINNLKKLTSFEASKSEEDVIWALKDISFEVKHGETLGVIGRNGAGKSTLLKIISRITEPSKGEINLFGRVGSLLEVGTGFHPELTGRENVYMNGTILGMSKKEINKKFDEIIDFSGVEKFIDTPIKRYSSGMKVRLAFSVAANLDPEILIIDEVLAVGDSDFQNKCINKMSTISNQGRTILFVSHNMAALTSLCTRGIYINEGLIEKEGTSSEVVKYYLDSLESASILNISTRSDRKGAGNVRLVDVIVSDYDNNRIVSTGGSFKISFKLNSKIKNIICNFTIYDIYGQPVANFNSTNLGPSDLILSDADDVITFAIDELLIRPGRYRLNTQLIHAGTVEDHVEGAAYFEVEQGKIDGKTVPMFNGFGSLTMRHKWMIA